MIFVILYSIVAVICFIGYLIHCVKDSKMITLLDVLVAFIIATVWIVSLLFFIFEHGDNIIMWRKK